ncbi:hypothetical protein ACLBXM_03280 [Xanthobacteraceae bacterium A53D]
MVIAIALGTALMLGIAAAALPFPAATRLSPALFPLLLAGLVWVSAGFVLRQGPSAPDAPRAGLRAIAATVAAMLILALATRAGGVFLAVLASATLAAAGVTGCTWRRAALVGLGLAVSVSLCLMLMRRQPLPILPPGLLS